MTYIEEIRKAIAKHALEDVENIDAETDFTTLPRMDSISHVELVMDLEEQFVIEITDEEAEANKTLLSLNLMVTNKLAAKGQIG
jgi:acyl carrier protein